MTTSKYFRFLVLIVGALCLVPVPTSAQDWHDALDIGLTGQFWKDLDHPYDRLPAKAKGVVRDPVWRLGTNTAGLSVIFETNSESIHVKWTVRYGNSMWHMTNCGVRGVDLYMSDDGRWKYAGSGSPGSGKSYERELIKGLDGQAYQFILDLPLYDGIDTLWIGVDEGSTLKAVDPFEGKPIVIYPRYMEFMHYIRQERPDIPVFLVETATTVKSALVPGDKEQLDRQNAELGRAYRTLKHEGVNKLYLISGDDLIGTDSEGTVDGVHYTDLGFMRYAEKVARAISQFVNY